jgi:hypothetical protein
MASSATRCKLNLVEVAETVPRVIDGPLSRVWASEDLDALVTAIFVHFLDAPFVRIDAVAEDLSPQVVSVWVLVHHRRTFPRLFPTLGPVGSGAVVFRGLMGWCDLMLLVHRKRD